jgi:hypothetical protein
MRLETTSTPEGENELANEHAYLQGGTSSPGTTSQSIYTSNLTLAPAQQEMASACTSERMLAPRVMRSLVARSDFAGLRCDGLLNRSSRFEWPAKEGTAPPRPIVTARM